MKNSSFKQLTALTGYRYNMFGKTLEHVGRDEQQRELIKANQDRVINFESDEEREKWIKEIEDEVEMGEKAIALTSELYQNSIKNCVASSVLLILSIFMLNLYFSAIFLLPVMFFGLRIINFIQTHRIQSGFLSIGKWIIQENNTKKYNPSHSYNVPSVTT